MLSPWNDLLNSVLSMGLLRGCLKALSSTLLAREGSGRSQAADRNSSPPQNGMHNNTANANRPCQSRSTATRASTATGMGSGMFFLKRPAALSIVTTAGANHNRRSRACLGKPHRCASHRSLDWSAPDASANRQENPLPNRSPRCCGDPLMALAAATRLLLPWRRRLQRTAQSCIGSRWRIKSRHEIGIGFGIDRKYGAV